MSFSKFIVNVTYIETFLPKISEVATISKESMMVSCHPRWGLRKTS